jgi:hypothetical protein
MRPQPPSWLPRRSPHGTRAGVHRPGKQLYRATDLAKPIAAAAPLGVRATLASARPPLSASEKLALVMLRPEFGRRDEKRGSTGISAGTSREVQTNVHRTITTACRSHDPSGKNAHRDRWTAPTRTPHPGKTSRTKADTRGRLCRCTVGAVRGQQKKLLRCSPARRLGHPRGLNQCWF